MKRALLTIALLALIAAGAVGIASAQGEDVSLKGLAGYVKALQRRVGANEQRLAAIETRIAPTATPRPTSTPAPTATSFAKECDGSAIEVLEVINVSAGNARRFQLLLSMGSGCDQTDALAFASAHSTLMTLGTVPFHVLF